MTTEWDTVRVLQHQLNRWERLERVFLVLSAPASPGSTVVNPHFTIFSKCSQKVAGGNVIGGVEPIKDRMERVTVLKGTLPIMLFVRTVPHPCRSSYAFRTLNLPSTGRVTFPFSFMDSICSF